MAKGFDRPLEELEAGREDEEDRLNAIAATRRRLLFEFTERDLVSIKQLEFEGYKFTEIVMTDRNGKERFIKIATTVPNPGVDDGK